MELVANLVAVVRTVGVAPGWLPPDKDEARDLVDVAELPARRKKGTMVVGGEGEEVEEREEEGEEAAQKKMEFFAVRPRLFVSSSSSSLSSLKPWVRELDPPVLTFTVMFRMF